MNWTRRHTLVSGIALILITNAVALLGVAWNRAGEAECILKLTQRELQQPYRGLDRENSGLALRMNWRVFDKGSSWNYSSHGGSPDWLDQAKMAALGFDVAPARGDERDTNRWLRRQRSKEVLLVLELDGEAYHQAVRLARKDADEQDAKLAAHPDSPEEEALKRQAKQMHDAVRAEEQEHSRLFAIDAGLDRAALRARYADRSRYAIVPARVRAWSTDERGEIVGHIDRISTNTINVPYALRPIFAGGASGQTDSLPPYVASVAFGRRLEPWLLGISVAGN